MKAAFITSLLSALMSIFTVLGASAVTVAPGAEGWHGYFMLVSTLFFLFWIGMAFWLRPRPNLVPLPRWARGLLVSAGIVYILGNLLSVAG
jgi:hypothetical protein